ncbi:g3589 [Coccomyxa elongata]
MQDLDRDVKDAFNKCLMGTYQDRVLGMAKYWARDATFTHVSFKAFNRDDIWGVYHLWSLNNRGIGIEYLETICDKKGNSVLLDVLERCNVWWFPPFANQNVKIHTILDLRDTPNGKVIINQYDHTLLVESILYHQFPSLGRFLYKHVLPAGGSFVATIGNLLFEYVNHKTEVPKLTRPLLVDPEFSIPHTAEILFSRDASGRRALVYNAFADDALYYNTFFTVVGPEQIFGMFNFWANFNRKVEIRIQRVVPQGDRILVDAVQFFTPFFWPGFLHPLVWYNHILISTKDNPAGGKLITRADNHIIALEPFQRYNLGPFSWAYERLRLVNGKLFGYAGRSIHRFMEWYHSNHVADKVAAHVPNGLFSSPSKMAN